MSNAEGQDVQDQHPNLDDPSERQRWFLARREDEDGNIPVDLLQRASAAKRALIQLETAGTSDAGGDEGGGGEAPSPPGGAGSVNWTPLGPSVIARGQATSLPPVTGRLTSVAAGPGGARVYVGSSNGGAWFSADGGRQWAPLDDYAVSPTFASGLNADSLAVGAVGVRFGTTAATDTIYIGTGEPQGGDAYTGVGIRRSASGGSPGSWTLEAAHLAGRAFYKIVIDPDNPSIVIAATTVGMFRRPTTSPFTTWTQVTDPDFVTPAGPATDLVVAGTGASKLYYAAFIGGAVFRSPNAANGNWTALTGIPGGSGRIALAAGESDPTVAYALTQTGSLYRLVGTAFELVAGTPPMFPGGQGGYDIAAGVDPSNPNIVYLVGDWTQDSTGQYNLAFFRGTVTGASGGFNFGFTNTASPYADPTWIGRGVHADGHAFGFARNATNSGYDPTNVWVGSDGGIYNSTASGALGSFQPRNTGLAVAEIGYFAQRRDTDAVIFAGLQDNGTIRYWGEPATLESPRGDGGGVAIDPNDEYQVMRQYVRAGVWFPAATLAFFSPGLSRCTDGGASGAWSAINFPPLPAGPTFQQKTWANTENGSTSFYTKIATSPSGVSPTLVGFGTNRLWISSDWGTSWMTLPTATNPYTAPATAAAPLTQDTLPNSIREIAFASGTRIFAATRNQVFRYDQAGATWTMTPIPTAGLPATPNIVSIGVENPTAGTFYATLGGNGHDHVYYFDGTTWQSAGGTTLTQAVLDTPANAVVVDPSATNVVYVGTDVGCWKGQKSGAIPPTWTWTTFSSGLPESAITGLQVHQRTRLLRASLYGRGMWEIPMDASSVPDTELYLRVNSADTGRTSATGRFPWVEGAPDPRRKTFSVYHWMSPDIKVRRPSLPNPDPLSTPPDYLDFAVNIDDYVDTNNTETVDETGVNRIFIQVHNRGRVGVPAAQVRVLLLLTDAAAGLPALPANYTTRINSGDTTNWVAGTAWRFADPMSPYRSPATDVDARNPGVVFYDFDFSSLMLPAGHTHVCAAAFVTTTTAADQLVGTTPSMDALTMQDRHAAHRNLHLVAAGATPVSPDAGEFTHDPQTVLVNFHNPEKEELTVDVVFDKRDFAGDLRVHLPRDPKLDRLKGFDRIQIGDPNEDDLRVHLDEWIRSHLDPFMDTSDLGIHNFGSHVRTVLKDETLDESAIAPLRKLTELDLKNTFFTNQEVAEIGGLRIPPQESQTAALTLQAPANAVPGDSYRFDVIQRSGEEILGGSTYYLVVTENKTEGSG